MRKSVLYGVENLYIFMPKQLRFKKIGETEACFRGFSHLTLFALLKKTAYAG